MPPRKRTRKRKRRNISLSASSSSDSDSDVSMKVAKSPINPPDHPVHNDQDSDSDSESSSSSSSSSTSSAPSQVSINSQHINDKEDAQMPSHKLPSSRSPSPPNAAIPPFFPPKRGRMAEDEEKEKELENKFRQFWMTSIADAFGDDLEEIRKEPNLTQSKLSLLIDALASGAEIYDKGDKETVLS